jgi:hypothetical protein
MSILTGEIPLSAEVHWFLVGVQPPNWTSISKSGNIKMEWFGLDSYPTQCQGTIEINICASGLTTSVYGMVWKINVRGCFWEDSIQDKRSLEELFQFTGLRQTLLRIIPEKK